MNCLIVGYGSIGQRHAQILNKLDCRVAVVSQRKIDFPLRYSSLYSALIQEKPHYVVIANQTNKHYSSLVELIDYGFNGIVLVEKPIFDIVQNIPPNNFKKGYVGYNLRFHPIIQKVYEIIKRERILYTQVYVGQYLPDWRPDRDYAMSYSSKKDEGGGVLLDLSHELDYLKWFFKDWNNVTAIGGKYSSLQINSDDMYSIMLTMQKCPMVQVHLNYIDRISRREVAVITDNHTVKADLVKQTLQINDELIKYDINCNYTYFMQHKAIINGENDILCTLDEGLQTLKMIDAIKQSASERKWVNK